MSVTHATNEDIVQSFHRSTSHPAEKPITRGPSAEGQPPALLELPTDYPRPAVRSNRIGQQELMLGVELTEELRRLAREHDATIFVTFLVAWKVFLGRYGVQDDVVVGIPLVNGDRNEFAGPGGAVPNIVSLRTELSGNPPFSELLKRVQATTRGTIADQNIPSETSVEALHFDRNSSDSPFLQALFSLEKGIPSLPTLKIHRVTPYETILSPTITFDLSLSIVEQADQFQGVLKYSTDLFKAETILRLVENFSVLLRGVVETPTCPIRQLPLLSTAERRQLLVEWNSTSTGPTYETCIHELVEAQVERTPDAPAVRFQGEELTYRELNEQANQLAHYLKGLGVGPESLVGICMERSLELVVALLGVLKAGAAYLPLDPVYPKDRLSFMLSDAAVRVLLTQKRLVPSLPDHDAHRICLDADCRLTFQESSQNPAHTATPGNLAYVIYTSGSTGLPKGVMICHRGVCNYLNWRHHYFPLSTKDRLLQTASISFDDSVWQIFEPLTCGALLVLVESGGEQDMARLVQLIRQDEITAANFVPSLLRAFLDEPGVENCKSIRRITTGGETLSIELQNQVFELLPTQFYNGYGPTETTIGSTFWTCQRNSPLTTVPIGRPIANVEVFVLDPHLQPVPIGVPGELYIGGIGLARGYLNRPDLTDQKFIPHPFDGGRGSRIYQTGDRVRWSTDGNLEFLGRLDQQIKLRGFRIELGEIEAVLNSCANVKTSVVILHDASSGEKQLVAYIVPRPDAPQLSIAELRDSLRARLPRHMIPAVIIVLEELPLTPNGKLDRRALPAPQGYTSEPAASHAEAVPQTSDEKQLALIWARLLKLPQLGIHDNFFELGGHSLLATRMIALARSELKGVEFTLRDLFEAPTIAGVLARSEKETCNRVDADLPASRGRQLEAGDGSHPLPSALVAGLSNAQPASRTIDPGDYVEVLRPGASHMPPVICIGDTRPVPFLFSRLPVNIPVLSLKLDGVQVLPPAYLTLDQVADLYRRALQRYCNQQRAVLVGFSYGGLLAYRLASELTQNGWSNLRVLLIEPATPKDYWSNSVRLKKGMRKIRNRLGLTRHGLLRGFFPADTTHRLDGESEQLESDWEMMLPHYGEIIRTARLSPQQHRLVLAGSTEYHADFAASWTKISGRDVVPCLSPTTAGHFSCFQRDNSVQWLDSLETLYQAISSTGGTFPNSLFCGS